MTKEEQDTNLFVDDIGKPIINNDCLLLSVQISKQKLKNELRDIQPLPLLNRLAIAFKDGAKDYSNWVTGNIIKLNKSEEKFKMETDIQEVIDSVDEADNEMFDFNQFYKFTDI